MGQIVPKNKFGILVFLGLKLGLLNGIWLLPQKSKSKSLNLEQSQPYFYF